MPALSIFYGIIIRMYSEARSPHKMPHLHAVYQQQEAVYDFDGNKRGNMIYPVATDVKTLADYKLLVTFDNGERRVYDAKPLIKGEWFGKLHDERLFKTAHIAAASVEWADGQDIAPDELYCASVAATENFA